MSLAWFRQFYATITTVSFFHFGQINAKNVDDVKIKRTRLSVATLRETTTTANSTFY